MKKKRESPTMSEIPTASLADISFLLLIFFLSTTMFALEEGIPLVLPGRASGTIRVKRSDVCVIQTTPNGTITIDKVPATLDQVRTTIERRLAENDQLVVVIETHPNSEYGLMVDVLDELRLANARRISLKTMNVSGGGKT
jgi:biopolymer transport protein ExbD